MTDGRNKTRVEQLLTEQNQKLDVLANRWHELSGVMKRLAGLLVDIHQTNEGLRLELQYVRTARERAERMADFATATTKGDGNG